MQLDILNAKCSLMYLHVTSAELLSLRTWLKGKIKEASYTQEGAGSNHSGYYE